MSYHARSGTGTKFSTRVYTLVPVNTKTGLESSGQLVFFVVLVLNVLEYLGTSIDDVITSL
jgi:hypothetical protein